MSSAPAHEAVLVSTDRITLTFSERLQPGTVFRAVLLSPRPETPPDVQSRGRDIVVRLQDPLHPNTTYLLSVSTDLRDGHGVPLREPVTIAFATGPTIDHGRLEGVVREPLSGTTRPGLSILAIPVAPGDSLPNPTERGALYASETGADGRFSLNHIHPGNYFVYALRDRNRNGRADNGEPFALPDSLPVRIDSLANELSLFTTTVDSLAPELRTTEVLSDQRFRLRFSESVTLRGRTLWTAVDSASGMETGAYAYQREDFSPDVFVWSEESLSPGTYRLDARAPDSRALVADSLGNHNVLPIQFSFAANAPSDTARVRFSAFEPAATDSVTRYRDEVRAVFSVPPNTAPPEVELVVRTEEGERVEPGERTLHGVDRILGPQAGLLFEDRFQASVVFPDTTYTASFALLDSDDLGGIVGRVVESRTTVVATGEDGVAHPASLNTDGTFRIHRLVAGAYTLLFYLDRNGNGRWDGGVLFPYTPPEPIAHLPEPVIVRARWESDVGELQIEN